MVDDLLAISECGFKTSMTNAYIKTKTDGKKLQFGAEKCKKMHIGKTCQNFKCQNLKVDEWKEVEVFNQDTGIDEIKDIIKGEKDMENKQEEKYLGDVISCDGRNIKNVKARVGKGKGIVSRILTIMEGIPFGKYYYEVGVIIRNSLLVSSMLCNTEAWYSITQAEIELLETVDTQFLRKLINAPRATPKEVLFLELGVVPFRELIMKRRIMFLHHILNEEPGSMINRFFQTQLKSPKQKDWVKTVKRDLEELEIEQKFEEIKQFKKGSLKRTLNVAVSKRALQRLNKIKEKHSKVINLNYSQLKMQNYLKGNRTKISQNMAEIIFSLRSRVTKVKMNYKGSFENLECEVCKEEQESQKHIIQECKKMLKIKGNSAKDIDYEKIFSENVKQQIEIAKQFEENWKIRNSMGNRD